jgi:large subunit ribosomal protein L21
MYAVVEIGGHQYRVSKGDVLFVDRQAEETGSELTFDRVLLINDGQGGVTIGKPVVEGAAVEAKLIEHVKADKVIVFKKKRRKGYKVKNGHRQPMSQIEISEISTSGGAKKSVAKSAPKASAEKSAPAAEAPEAGTTTVSTDMTAKEAIEHINSTPLDQLQGFVPETEERVTVLQAWDSKQKD